MLAATLAYHKLNVHWVVRNALRRDEIRSLRVAYADSDYAPDFGPFRFYPDVDDLPENLDWLILAVKAHQVLPIIDRPNALSPPEVLVVANGLQQLNVHLGLFYGGALYQPGRVSVSAEAKLLVGRLAGEESHHGAIVSYLNAPWVKCGGNSNITIRMWHKLALNCVVNPLTALLDCDNGALPHGAAAPLILNLLDEVHQVALLEHGEYWPFSLDQLLADLAVLLQETADNSSSMREDVLHGRETEIDSLNLAVASLGRCFGVPCIYNESVGKMLRALTNKRHP
ncbi:hypothetical protein JW859_09770 [bacterium]|nr:hypothetical protein [bacterium]